MSMRTRARRMALGTAQFGLDYGVANDVGQVPDAEMAAILRRARDAGVDTLDTAAVYGDSERRLGEYGVPGWHVVTKLPSLPAEVADPESWVASQVVASLDRLRRPRVDALLLHRPHDLLGPTGEALWHGLEAVRGSGLARAIGYSVYDPSELEALFRRFPPDLVQAPLNVLDRRLVRSGWLARLADAGVVVHARSAFLQGLLAMPAAQRPACFGRWEDTLGRWDAWCLEGSRHPARAALDFVLGHAEVDRVVVGIDSVRQLDELLAAESPPESYPAIESDDRDLIEPFRWPSR